MLRGCIIAFSTYSAIPMPKVEWSEKNRRWSICFFPLIGGVIGGVVLLAYMGWEKSVLAPQLAAALLVLLPVILSGGIHMDGFIDTCDALASHQDTERKLAILKDPNTGAFGILGCAGYLLLSYGLWIQLLEEPRFIGLAAVGHILSRGMSGFCVAALGCAKNSGLLYAFADPMSRRGTKLACGLWMALCGGLCLRISPAAGGVMIVTAGIWMFFYKRLCYRGFGGNTGDLAGFFLQVSELLFLAVGALGGVFMA